VGIPAWCGSGGWGLVQLRGRYPAVCGSGARLWSCAAQVVVSTTKWSSGSGDFQGKDLAGYLFFY
jgi:hypothetical protein